MESCLDNKIVQINGPNETGENTYFLIKEKSKYLGL